MLTPKKCFKDYQLKPGNTSQIIINEFRQIIYSLYPEKEFTTKV